MGITLGDSVFDDSQTSSIGGGSSSGGGQGSSNDNNEDLAKLEEILEKIQIILQRVVEARHILFRESLRGHINDAWTDLNDEDGMIGLRKRVALRRAALLGDPSLLKNAGLSGAHLSLKYQGILESYENLHKKGGTRRLKRFIKWAKIVVGSLATMVPILKEVAEILNEYLEGVEMGIEDAEDAE